MCFGGDANQISPSGGSGGGLTAQSRTDGFRVATTVGTAGLVALRRGGVAVSEMGPETGTRLLPELTEHGTTKLPQFSAPNSPASLGTAFGAELWEELQQFCSTLALASQGAGSARFRLAGSAQNRSPALLLPHLPTISIHFLPWRCPGGLCPQVDLSSGLKSRGGQRGCSGLENGRGGKCTLHALRNILVVY